MFKKIMKILGWIALLGIFGFTVAFTSMESQSIQCREVEISYEGPQVISVGDDGIMEILKNADRGIIGKNINQINAEFLEQELKRNQTIEKAEVYKTVVGEGSRCKGILNVQIKHRVPVLRVMTSEKDYYLDKNMVEIPTSTRYSTDVLVATGNIKPEFASTWLVPMASFIETDPFWKAQIEQISVLDNGEIVIVPLVGGHVVEFGKPEDFQDKLVNLRAFYEDKEAQNNWNKYKSISLKYKNQVIGTKK